MRFASHPAAGRHPRLSPAAVEVEGDRQRHVGERADREAQPQARRRRARDRRRARSRAGPDTRPMTRMISGPITAPLARTVPNRTIVTPNSRKLQVASSWICAGDRQRRAVAAEEQRRARAGRRPRAATTSAAGDQQVVDDAGAGDRADPVPLAGADILRGHRAHRGAERHRRHLDIGPQLHARRRRRRRSSTPSRLTRPDQSPAPRRR